MPSIVRPSFVSGMAALAIGALSAGCGPVQLNSGWRHFDVVPDGNPQEWRRTLDLVKPLKSDVGIVNDDSTLYMCLIVRDEELNRRIATSGLHLWFDSARGDRKRFGIGFPLARGRSRQGSREGGFVRGGEPGEEDAPSPRRDAARAEWKARLQDDELEILGSNAITPMPVADVPGVRVAIAVSRSGALVYEIAVPLERTTKHPYAIEAHPGALIGVGFEIPALHPPERGSETSDTNGEPPHGRRGRGGAGGRRGGMGRRSANLFEPWEAWARLKLAVPD